MTDRPTRIEPEGPDSSLDPGATLVRAGRLVELRLHTEANREPFIRWYADAEIARLLRHDLEPLSRREASAYFGNIILPLSERGQCWAIHRSDSGALIGTAAITDLSTLRGTCLYRVVIGEKDAWGQGFGTEATRLVAQQVFETLPVTRFRLEVFAHNPRALRAYERVGFRQYDRYDERVFGTDTVLDIIAMELTPEALASNMPEAGMASTDRGRVT
jgi:RimJ/RimL family protein N-acetyltransferase